MDIDETLELGKQLIQEDEDDMTLRDRLIAYCDHILDDIEILAQNYDSLESTEEYSNIEYYAKMIQRDLEEKKDLEEIS